MAVSRMVSDGPDMLPPGASVGRYVIGRVLGAGGGGVVYSGHDRGSGREVAIKVLRRDMASSPVMIARFIREAGAANKIRHPNIVQTFEFGQLPDARPYYAMELLRGKDLRRLIRERGRFTPEDALRILEQVCSALEAAHCSGVVHRDLKAGNIIVCEDGDRWTAKLLDFGIAKLLHPEQGDVSLTAAGLQLGTSYNMAPEQIRAEPVDERADVYALGVLLYQLLTGQLPFVGEHRDDIAWMHLQAPAPRPSKAAPVLPVLDSVVLRCMEKDRDRRYPSVGAFLDDLRRACGKRTLSDERIVRAIAICVDVQLESDDGDDTAMIDDVVEILDSAEQSLVCEGWRPALHTSNTLVTVQLLEGRSMAVSWADATALVKRVRDQIESRRGAHPCVQASVRVRVGDVSVLHKPGDLEIVGGPLLCVDEWPAPR